MKLVGILIFILAIQQILILSYLPVAKTLSEASHAQLMSLDFYRRMFLVIWRIVLAVQQGKGRRGKRGRW
jgi:hypothetical protein